VVTHIKLQVWLCTSNFNITNNSISTAILTQCTHIH